MPTEKKNKTADMQLLIEEINNSPEVMVFLKKLWKDKYFQRLFFAQKQQIFPIISEDFIKLEMPYLFFGNFLQQGKEENNSKESISVFTTTSELEQEKVENFKKISSEPIEEMTGELRDFLIYYLIKFIRSNKKIKQLIESEDFSYELMKSTLKDYSEVNIDVFDDCNEIFNEVDTSKEDEIDKDTAIIRRKMVGVLENIKTEFESKWFDIFKYIDFSGIKGEFYIWGYQKILKFLKTQGIKEDHYKNILSELYRLKLIENTSTAFWCKSCLDEPFISHSQSKIAPTQCLLKCPKCKKDMTFSTAYSLHPLLKRMIDYQDGLLSCAFAWVLINKNVEYISSGYSTKYEMDFEITTSGKEFLVECKMHNTAKDKQAIKDHLINDLTQLISHMKALEEEGKKVNGGYVLTNHLLGNRRDIVKSAYNNSRKIKEYRKEHNIKIFDYTQIAGLLEEFGVKSE